jgi:hypothetical protein
MGSAAPRRPVHIAVLIAGAAYTAALYWSGVDLDTVPKKLLTYLPGAVALVYAIWDGWLWRAPLLRKASARPIMRGLWRGELRPTADSQIPEGGNKGPIPMYIVVHQRFWSTRIEQFTEESYSKSRSYFWERCTDDSIESLGFVYENQPRQAHRHRSPRHLGVCWLRIPSKLPTTIEGWYFTDRYTQGDMDFALVDRSSGHASFAEIEKHVAGITHRG